MKPSTLQALFYLAFSLNLGVAFIGRLGWSSAIDVSLGSLMALFIIDGWVERLTLQSLKSITIETDVAKA